MDIDGEERSSKEYTKTVYAHILIYFEKLKHFNVSPTTIFGYPSLSICYLPSNTFFSLILTYLSINVRTFTDCLCLLDGRLRQLSTLIVQIYSMKTNLSVVHNLVCIFCLFQASRVFSFDN